MWCFFIFHKSCNMTSEDMKYSTRYGDYPFVLFWGSFLEIENVHSISLWGKYFFLEVEWGRINDANFQFLANYSLNSISVISQKLPVLICWLTLSVCRCTLYCLSCSSRRRRASWRIFSSFSISTDGSFDATRKTWSPKTQKLLLCKNRQVKSWDIVNQAVLDWTQQAID